LSKLGSGRREKIRLGIINWTMEKGDYIITI
jgi:hypothetical protein